MEFAKFIKDRCRGLGITYQEIDLRADIAMGNTSKYSRGEKKPTLITALKFIDALELDDDGVAKMFRALRNDAIERGDIYEL